MLEPRSGIPSATAILAVSLAVASVAAPARSTAQAVPGREVERPRDTCLVLDVDRGADRPVADGPAVEPAYPRGC